MSSFLSSQDEATLIVKEMIARGKIRNPENPLNIHSVGVFYTNNSFEGKRAFSTHYFNQYGLEVGMFHNCLKSGMIFSNPREWGLSNLNTLEITTDLYKHDLTRLETFQAIKIGL